MGLAQVHWVYTCRLSVIMRLLTVTTTGSLTLIPTLGIKEKLLMSLVRLPWEPVANESLGFPLTFGELEEG